MEAFYYANSKICQYQNKYYSVLFPNENIIIQALLSVFQNEAEGGNIKMKTGTRQGSWEWEKRYLIYQTVKK